MGSSPRSPANSDVRPPGAPAMRLSLKNLVEPELLSMMPLSSPVPSTRPAAPQQRASVGVNGAASAGAFQRPSAVLEVSSPACPTTAPAHDPVPMTISYKRISSPLISEQAQQERACQTQGTAPSAPPASMGAPRGAAADLVQVRALVEWLSASPVGWAMLSYEHASGVPVACA